MKALLIGNGAREHIIAERLSSDCELYALMSKKNPAIASLAKEHWICDIEDPSAIGRAISGKRFDLGFASPDGALAAGASDVLVKAGMPVASPTRAAARIEWDKSYMRGLLERHRIKGSARHVVARDMDSAYSAIRGMGEVAIKPLGLTGGKGVKVSGDHFTEVEDGLAYARSLLEKDRAVLVEEKLVGEEFTLQAFCDGANVSPMPPVQDHKRAYEGELGPNTGGMGSYSTGRLLPFLGQGDLDSAVSIIRSVAGAMKEEGVPFHGILYGQFMATADGVRVIEFNARFGDPEAMNVLTLLEGSLSEIFLSMAEGKLRQADFSRDCTVVKYLVPKGYPDAPVKDAQFTVNDDGIRSSRARAYYASVYEDKGRILTTGSRAVGIVGRAPSLDDAERSAEKACGFVKGPLWHRSDIGTKALIESKVSRMKGLRGRG
ncbi:MAG: phosphoribosylamine--glycine ligase [Candidatus Micrarchaeia archaeon]